MTDPPGARPHNILQVADNLAPALEVRSHEGDLIGRVTTARAVELETRGWVRPVGKTKVRYLELTAGAPWRPVASAWTGKDNTQRIRNDAGVIVGPDYALAIPIGNRRHSSTGDGGGRCCGSHAAGF
jgi:hypothetical protein